MSSIKTTASLRKTIRNFLIGIFFIILLIYVYFFTGLKNSNLLGSDFISFYTGATILKNDSEKLYNLDFQKFVQNEVSKPFFKSFFNRFVLPPFAALIYLPVTYVNYFLAYKIFFLINFALFSLFLYLLFKIINIKKQKIFFTIMAASFYPTFGTLAMGQTSFLLAIVFLLIYWRLKLKKSFSAGLITGLLLIKPQLFISLPFLLIISSKKIQYLKGATISVMLLLLLNIAIVKFNYLTDYYHLVISTEGPIYGNNPESMLTVYGALSSLFSSTNFNRFVIFLINVVLYIFALYFFYGRFRDLELSIAYIGIIIFSLLFSIHLLGHDLVILLLPMSMLFTMSSKINSIVRNLLLASLYLFPISNHFGLVIVFVIILFILTGYFLNYEKTKKLFAGLKSHGH